MPACRLGLILHGHVTWFLSPVSSVRTIHFSVLNTAFFALPKPLRV
nr:MAG TPA: hypothetical protein [Caudoviricetes sp.]